MKATDKNMMRGKNDLSSDLIYYYRLLYSVVHSVGSPYKKIGKSVRNFENGERVMYGRVDREYVAILPKEELLVAPSGQTGTQLVRVMPFVADAFEDFQKAFQSALYAKKISGNDAFLSTPMPKKGYMSPTQQYKEYRRAMFKIFIKYLDALDCHKKITDFESFQIYFMDFVRNTTARAPFTIEGFQRSHLAHPHMSGLVIDLADTLDPADDKAKVEKIFESPNYRFYENAAMQFGFSIDKNCPWRLVADLGSPVMLTYMENRGFSSVDRVLRKCYDKAYMSGYNIFKTMLEMYYNSYIDLKKRVVFPKRNSKGDYISASLKRSQTSLADLSFEYGESYFLEKYITIRNLEEGGMFSEQKVQLMLSRSLEMIQISGTESALKYINEQLSDTTNRSGSLAQRKHRRKKKKEEEKALQSQPKPGTMKY